MPRSWTSLGLLAMTLPLWAAIAGAAPPADTGRTLIYAATGFGRSEGVIMDVPHAEGGRVYTRLRTVISNRSPDLLAVYPGEMVFLYPHVSLSPELEPHQQKARVVPPRDHRYVELSVGGVDGLDVRAFDLDVNGLYRVPLPEGPVEATPIDPHDKSVDFTAGPFTCRRAAFERADRDLSLRLACTYRGERVGVVVTDAPRLMVEGGRPSGYPARVEKPMTWVLRPEESTRFDLNFRLPGRLAEAGPGSYRVDVSPALAESDLLPLTPFTLRLEAVDEASTTLVR